VQGFYNP